MSKKKKILLAVFGTGLLILLVFLNLVIGPRVVIRGEIGCLGDSLKSDEDRHEWRFSDLFQTYYIASRELSEAQWNTLRETMTEDGWNVHVEDGAEEYSRVNKVKCFLVSYFCHEKITKRMKGNIVFLEISIVVNNQFEEKQRK